MQIPDPSRRAVLGGLAAGLGLTACGTSPTLELIGNAFSKKNVLGAGNAYPLTPDRIREIPYASMGVNIGGNEPGVLILASYSGEDMNWVSADRIVIVTRAGRLVKTVGLDRDLIKTQWTGSDPVLDAARGVAAGHGVARFIDVRPNDAYGVGVESRIRIVGRERIDILDRSFDTTVIEERVSMPKWRWSTTNRFWVDSAGGIIRSQQRYCPEVETMTLEVLKPAATKPG